MSRQQGAQPGNDNAAKGHTLKPIKSALAPLPVAFKPISTGLNANIKSQEAALAASKGALNQKIKESELALHKAEKNLLDNRSADSGLLRNMAANAMVAARVLSEPLTYAKGISRAGVTSDKLQLSPKLEGRQVDLYAAILHQRNIALSGVKQSKATNEAERIYKDALAKYEKYEMGD